MLADDDVRLALQPAGSITNGHPLAHVGSLILGVALTLAVLAILLPGVIGVVGPPSEESAFIGRVSRRALVCAVGFMAVGLAMLPLT